MLEACWGYLGSKIGNWLPKKVFKLFYIKMTEVYNLKFLVKVVYYFIFCYILKFPVNLNGRRSFYKNKKPTKRNCTKS